MGFHEGFYKGRIEKMLQMKNRDEAIEVMKQAYDKGFRYVVRDFESLYLCFFNYKPKKYRDLESWGYRGQDLAKNDCLSSTVILKNEDITEINWKNQKPTLIMEFIEKEIGHERV